MTAGYQPDRCTCSHAIGQHQSAGTKWPYPPSYGVCLVPGCECREFNLQDPSSRKEPQHDQDEAHPHGDYPDRPDVAAGNRRGAVVVGAPQLTGDAFHDALQDARAELAGEGVYVSERDAVIASLNAPRGNGDMYPHLRDRHPFGWSPFTVPTDGHPNASFPAAGVTRTGLRPPSPPSAGTQADGSPDLPTAA